MNNPEYVKIGEKKYKINTDFRVAIKCNCIAEDTTISDTERALAIIYLLYGDEGLNDFENHEKLMELAKKYLLCGEEPMDNIESKKDMDYIQDKYYIRSSFIQDYKYNPYEKEYLHWYDFYHDLNNLSNSEFGNCCILSRIRNFRNLNVSEIKDSKKRAEIIKIKEYLALKKEIKMTEEQKKNQDNFYKLLNGGE